MIIQHLDTDLSEFGKANLRVSRFFALRNKSFELDDDGLAFFLVLKGRFLPAQDEILGMSHHHHIPSCKDGSPRTAHLIRNPGPPD